MRSALQRISVSLVVLLVAILPITLAPSPADAVTVTWATTGSDPTDPGSSGLGPDAGNIKSFTNSSPNGYTLKAAGFSMATLTGQLQDAYLAAYGGGLGVGAPPPATGETTSPGHAVDNVGGYDMVIFSFPTDVWDALSVHLNPYGSSPDTDLTFFVGGKLSDFGDASDPFSGFAGKTLAEITSLGTWNQHENTGNGSSRTASLNPNDNTERGRYLIIAAQITSSDRDDYFKIDSVTGDPVVPEPSTFLLMGMGLVGVVFWKSFVPHRALSGSGAGTRGRGRLAIPKVRQKNPTTTDRLIRVARNASDESTTVLTLKQYAPTSYALASNAL